MDKKEIAKKVAGTSLDAVKIMAIAGKYGVSFTWGLSKTCFNGAQNIANQFASGPKLGIGDFLIKETEKAASNSFDFSMKQLAKLRNKVR